MKRLYRFYCEDWEEFIEDVNNGADKPYRNANGEEYDFHLEPGGIGFEMYVYKTDTTHDYETLEELYENHIMPDGVSFKDAYNGENYLKEE